MPYGLGRAEHRRMNKPPTCANLNVAADPGWAVIKEFLDAFARRDFAAMEACLDSDVCFRALVPPSP